MVISEYLVLDYLSLQLEDINSGSFLIDSAELGKTKFKNHGKKDNGQQKRCVWYSTRGARNKRKRVRVWTKVWWFIWRRWWYRLSGGGVALRLGDQVKVKRY